MIYQNRTKRIQKQLSGCTMGRQIEAEVNECPNKTKPGSVILMTSTGFLRKL